MELCLTAERNAENLTMPRKILFLKHGRHKDQFSRPALDLPGSLSSLLYEKNRRNISEKNKLNEK